VSFVSGATGVIGRRVLLVFVPARIGAWETLLAIDLLAPANVVAASLQQRTMWASLGRGRSVHRFHPL